MLETYVCMLCVIFTLRELRWVLPRGEHIIPVGGWHPRLQLKSTGCNKKMFTKTVTENV